MRSVIPARVWHGGAGTQAATRWVMAANTTPTNLSAWLGLVSKHLETSATRAKPQPPRRRDRERARREARALFREYDADLALSQALFDDACVREVRGVEQRAA
jgi:hypothetical protein